MGNAKADIRSEALVVLLVHLLRLILELLLLQKVNWQVRRNALLLHASLVMGPCV